MTAAPEDPYVVTITLKDVYNTVKTIEATTAQLANNAQHAEDWRVTADREIKAHGRLLSGCVTRRELYATVAAIGTLVGALSPILARIYGGP